MATSKASKTIKKQKPVKKTVKVRTKKEYDFQPKSFQIAEGPKPFVSFKITRQTIYWLILLAYISALTLWVLSIQLSIYEKLSSIM